MGPLSRWITLRHLFQEGGRSLLTILGVALGVAVFVSIRLANHSAMASFADTVDAVAGKANLQVVSDTGGFDERFYTTIRSTSGVQAAAPVVQVHVRAAPGRATGPAISLKTAEDTAYPETLLLLGLDLFAEEPFARYEPPRREERFAALRFLTDPRAIAVTRSLADRYALKEGDPVTVVAGARLFTLNVRQILDSPELQQAMGGNVVITDIAVAQEVFERFGKLDRIDLLVDPQKKEQVRATIERQLPAHVRVAQPQGRTQQVENMVRAFDLNLTALSFIALFVSMFLIFNAVSMSVLRRRREIGILRSLGLERGQVVRLFLLEALFLGFAGSLAGLALGTLMAQGALHAVSRTISALYLVVHAENVYLDPRVYALGFLLGMGMSLLSALGPAIEASLTPPSLTVRQGTLIEAQPLPLGKFTVAGFATLAAAAGFAAWTVGERQPLGGFASAFLLLIGFSLLSPGTTLLGERLLSPLARAVGGIEGMLGARYLREAVARTSVVVAALMVSVGMMIGLSIMVGSFRKTVDTWVSQTIRGDLYVEAVGRTISGAATALPPEVVEAAENLPGVAAVDTLRSVQVTHNGRLAYVAGINFRVQEEHGQLQFLRGDAAEILARAREGEGAIVSESFAFRNRVKEGDTIRMPTPAGETPMRVEGIYYDYSTDAGAVMVHYPLFWKLWRDRRTESLAIYVEPGVDVSQVRNRFVAAVGDRAALYVTPNRTLRSRVMVIFDQTFQITYALQGISILVAVLGVISTLTALILQRGREIGVLRGVGAMRSQVRKMVLVESGLLGLIGAALGCVCGIALSLLLTYVINKQFFGWSIRWTLEPWLFVQTVVLMVVTAIIAGLVPARLAANKVAAEAMRVD